MNTCFQVFTSSCAAVFSKSKHQPSFGSCVVQIFISFLWSTSKGSELFICNEILSHLWHSLSSACSQENINIFSKQFKLLSTLYENSNFKAPLGKTKMKRYCQWHNTDFYFCHNMFKVFMKQFES